MPPSILSPILFIDIGIVLCLLVGFGLALPQESRRRIRLNCYRLDGSWSLARALREFDHLLDLTGKALLVPGFLLLTGNLSVLAVHWFVIPLPLATEVFDRFHPHPRQWEHGIEDARAGDLTQKHEEWYVAQGGSEETARFWQDVMWSTWPVLGLGAFVLVLLAFRLTGKAYGLALKEFHTKLLERQGNYVRHDVGLPNSLPP